MTEQALTSVVSTCYLPGVSTWRMDKLGDGYREILGVRTATSGTAANWLSFFRDLTSAGPVGLVSSDAHTSSTRSVPPCKAAKPTTLRT